MRNLELKVRCSDSATLDALATQALDGVLGARAVVEKRRALYRYGDTRYTWTSSEDALGIFVEIETVLPRGEQAAARRAANEPAMVAEHRAVVELFWG